MRHPQTPSDRARPRWVLLSVPLVFSSARETILGIFNYPGPDQDWDFFMVEDSADAIRRAARWRMDGVIGAFGRSDLARAAGAFRVPVVNLHGGNTFGGFAQVGTDNGAIGEAAARYLLDLGFERFAFVGLPGDDFSDTREAGFRAALSAAGHAVVSYDRRRAYPRVRRPPPHTPQLQANLCQFLAGLPRPAAVFCSDDLRAFEAAKSCRHLGIAVPDEIAVLGVNDDDIRCQGSAPPLSSVRLPNRKVGHEAARLLDRLMRGERPRERRILLPPEGVVARQSTDVLHCADPVVAAALRKIREEAAALRSVNEVARAAAVSRRALERRFRAALGRTVLQELMRRRIELAQERLRRTDWPMERVAEAAGFSSGVYFSHSFRRAVGRTPREYRRQFRWA